MEATTNTNRIKANHIQFNSVHILLTSIHIFQLKARYDIGLSADKASENYHKSHASTPIKPLTAITKNSTIRNSVGTIRCMARYPFHHVSIRLPGHQTYINRCKIRWAIDFTYHFPPGNEWSRS
jgi:hypothetical protein